MITRFDKDNFRGFADELTLRDPDLKRIVDTWGYPPMWTRPPGFASLVLIILEQQVSLASAFAAYKKLTEFAGQITPEAILQMSDAELRACYFSRQKTGYVRHLANLITSGTLRLELMDNMSDEEVRTALKQVKGIGDWTADIYLIFCLQRADHFPVGDLAMVNSMRFEKRISSDVLKPGLIEIAEQWRPFRSIATMVLWHGYIRRKDMAVPDSYNT